MTDLSPSTRALLDAARAGMTPSTAAVNRMRANIGAAAAGSAVVSTLALKLGLAAVIATAAVGIGIVAERTPQPEPARIELVDQRGASAPGFAERVLAHEDLPIAPPAPQASSAIVEPSRSEPARALVPVPGIQLAREVELVDRAMAALRQGAPEAAVTAIAIYHHEAAGAGQLAEDAAAIEVEALCTLHDSRAAGLLASFDQQFPRSAQRSRLTTTCH